MVVNHAQLNSTAFVQYTGRHGLYSLELCSQVPVTGGDPDPCDHFYTVGQPEPVSIPSRFLHTDSPVSDPSDSLVRLSVYPSLPFSNIFVLLVSQTR